MEIVVTQDDIDRAAAFSVDGGCPIGRALARAGFTNIWVGGALLEFSLKDGRQLTFRIADSLDVFNQAFNEGAEVKPGRLVLWTSDEPRAGFLPAPEPALKSDPHNAGDLARAR